MHKLISIFTLILLVLVGLAFIFVFVVIMKPEPLQALFPQVRESVTALGTLAMVFATLLLAYATFGIINSDRRRKEHDRKEHRLNEINAWAKEGIRLSIMIRQGIPKDPRSLQIDTDTRMFFSQREYIRRIAKEKQFDVLPPLIEKVLTPLERDRGKSDFFRVNTGHVEDGLMEVTENIAVIKSKSVD